MSSPIGTRFFMTVENFESIQMLILVPLMEDCLNQQNNKSWAGYSLYSEEHFAKESANIQTHSTPHIFVVVKTLLDTSWELHEKVERMERCELY